MSPFTPVILSICVAISDAGETEYPGCCARIVESMLNCTANAEFLRVLNIGSLHEGGEWSIAIKATLMPGFLFFRSIHDHRMVDG
jgi:hypothetical protein